MIQKFTSVHYIFLQQLKYYTQIHVRSTRGKNAKGSKITGVEPLPGEDKVRERERERERDGQRNFCHLCLII